MSSTDPHSAEMQRPCWGQRPWKDPRVRPWPAGVHMLNEYTSLRGVMWILIRRSCCLSFRCQSGWKRGAQVVTWQDLAEIRKVKLLQEALKRPTKHPQTSGALPPLQPEEPRSKFSTCSMFQRSYLPMTQQLPGWRLQHWPSQWYASLNKCLVLGPL